MGRLTRFVEYSKVNLFAKLFDAGDASRIVRYLEHVLAPIEERDRNHRTQLKKTLLCYMDSQHNIARTAELLGVHINTVRQRLGTLREITGGWDDPVAALELHVALRLDSISAAPEPCAEPSARDYRASEDDPPFGDVAVSTNFRVWAKASSSGNDFWPLNISSHRAAIVSGDRSASSR